MARRSVVLAVVAVLVAACGGGGDPQVVAEQPAPIDLTLEGELVPLVPSAAPDGFELTFVSDDLDFSFVFEEFVPAAGLGVILSYQPTGALPDDFDSPMAATYPLTPVEHDRLRALLVDDPANDRAITNGTCCDPGTLDPPETTTVGGVDGTVGTLSTGIRVLLVPGDPGVAVFTKGNRVGDVFLQVDALAQIAESVEPVSVADLDSLSHSFEDPLIDAAFDEAIAAEAAQGWAPVVEGRGDDDRWAVTAGTDPRTDHLATPAPVACLVVARAWNSGTQSCLDERPGEPLVVADFVPGEGQWGTIEPGVMSVTVEHPDRSFKAEIVDAPALGAGVRVWFARVDVQTQIELTGPDFVAGRTDLVVVARGADGTEVARAPFYTGV